MQHQKGLSDQDLCHDSSGCAGKGWTWPRSSGSCHESPGSLSHDLDGSCQSAPQGCQPPEPCPAQQSCQPRRRVEVNHTAPACPPPARIHRRPLQQYRPSPPCQDQESCSKPRRRVEQCPPEDDSPPVVLQPLPLPHRHPCGPCCPPPVQRCPPPVQRCHPPVQRCPPPVQRCHPPLQRCCPAPIPLPPRPCHHQQKQVTLLPPCVQKC
ncbi:keratinocyte proline-rich protein-like [Pipra filicauda]|uniref:Keratinocyte proline-rich protein-like n=1 Tax=Pipra filicauda TaxID=649802 RepID=A0A6J2H6D6_9PASS|nr:keratinocyte proline-rich protein-like [Pipra filicauda]